MTRSRTPLIFCLRPLIYDANAGGDRLVGVGMDVSNSIAVYDWRHKCLLASGPSDKDKVYAISFYVQPVEEKDTFNKKSTCSSQALDTLVTCGQNHIKFWQIQGRSFKCQKGLMNGIGAKQSMMTAVATQDFVVSGAVDGSVYLWRGHR